MARTRRAEADPWYSNILTEMRMHLEDQGHFTRLVLTPSIDRYHVSIAAEIWTVNGRSGSSRTHLYARDYPHPDANFLSLACWQAVIKVWEQYDRGHGVSEAAD